jgi:hypothetical protein
VSQEDLDLVIRNLVTRAERRDDKAIHAFARLLDQSFGRRAPRHPPMTTMLRTRHGRR